ncbi:hypothetical protein NXZ66_05080 [Glaesserella parasuis]|nr:hypothetical protein NXZ66_05080 [Glaesserella parasuis]
MSVSVLINDKSLFDARFLRQLSTIRHYQYGKKWTMPIQNWKLAMNRFMIDFGDRLDDHR